MTRIFPVRNHLNTIQHIDGQPLYNFDTETKSGVSANVGFSTQEHSRSPLLYVVANNNKKYIWL